MFAIEQAGFHIQILINVTMFLTATQSDEDPAILQLHIDQNFALNPYDLKNIPNLKFWTNETSSDDIDFEAPAYKSKPYWFYFYPVQPLLQDVASIPLMVRYQEPSNESLYKNITLELPNILLMGNGPVAAPCSSDDIGQLCSWVYQEDPDYRTIEIPIGVRSHGFIVNLVTSAVIFASVLTMLFVLFRYLHCHISSPKKKN